MREPLPHTLPTEEEPSQTRGAPARHGRGYDCDACGKWFAGEPEGAGLFIWTRGDEVRYEEPPLCEACAAEIAVGALVKWESEQEEEG